MLETLNNAGCIAQLFGLHQESEKKHPSQGCQYEHETTWRPCLIAISSTSKTVVDKVLVYWKWPELTNNEQNWQIMSSLCKKTNEWTGDVPSHNQKFTSTTLDTRHFPCPRAFYLLMSILAKHDDLRYFWLFHLTVYAIRFYMTGFLWWNYLSLLKIGKKTLGSWI